MSEKPSNASEFEPKKEWGFSQLQTRVSDIYREHDLECQYGPSTMLAKLLGNAVTLKQVIRKTPDDFDSIDRSLTNIFIWAATFANEADMDLEKVLENKFGLGCPHCKQMPCSLAKGTPCEKPLLMEHQLPFIIPRSLEEWQSHLESMYPNNFTGNLNETLLKACNRVSDEIGELIGSSYRDIEKELKTVSFQDNMQPWESEIADAIAWSFAIANCLKRIRGTYSIEQSLRDKYDKGCPYCKSPKCVCPKAKTFIEELKR